MTDAVLLERSADVATVILNRPDRLNALDTPTKAQVVQTLERLGDDRDVRVVVLTGAGRAFCAGADLTRYPADDGAGPTVDAAVLRAEARCSQLLREMPQATIAMINGACAGAGLSWACACDLRVAAASARFNTAFLSAGLPGDHGISWTLPRLVGEARARELMLLPGKFDAATAHGYGLVSRVAADDDLHEVTYGLARRIADSAPLAVAAMKTNLAESGSRSFAEHLDRESARQVRIRGSADQREAVAAFLEKRRPVFTGH